MGTSKYKRRHQEQMTQMRKKVLADEDDLQLQPVNIPCMGSRCVCRTYKACSARKICDALF